MGTEARVRELVEEASGVFGLTGAELAVLCLAADGHDAFAITKFRSVARSTVKKQVQEITRKVGARSLAHAATIVLRLALVKACTVDRARLAS